MHTERKLYLIQGVFFQADLKHLFSGMIYPADDGGDGYDGLLHDEFGYSKLTNISVSDDRIAFTKRYRDRENHETHYTLKKIPDKHMWIGRYGGNCDGADHVNAVVSKVSPKFLTTRIVCTTDVITI